MEYYKNLDLNDIVYFCEFDNIIKTEQWKDIPDYEGIYQVSDLGRVKSIGRYSKNKQGLAFKKTRILKQTIGNHGYLTVTLCVNWVQCLKLTHVSVAVSFLNHIQKGFNIIVDHKDNIKTNNILKNLQLTNVRHNASKDRFRHHKTSKYVGVHLDKKTNKWIAQIRIGKARKYLGYFTEEIDAYNAYEQELKNLS